MMIRRNFDLLLAHFTHEAPHFYDDCQELRFDSEPYRHFSFFSADAAASRPL